MKNDPLKVYLVSKRCFERRSPREVDGLPPKPTDVSYKLMRNLASLLSVWPS